MVVVERSGIPLGGILASASPVEVELAEETLNTIKAKRVGKGRPKKRPKRLIGDKAYDSDPLRKCLKYLKIDFTAPHRRNRKKPKTQDGRKLRRYKRRWIVERTISWIGKFKRLLVCNERKIEIYQAFFNLACLVIVLKRF